MGLRQPGDLGVLREVIAGFSEEARTRGFASLTLVRFAFINQLNSLVQWETVNSGMYLADGRLGSGGVGEKSASPNSGRSVSQ